MRLWIACGFACLVFGLITTVGIAWYLTLTTTGSGLRFVITADMPVKQFKWITNVPSDWPDEPLLTAIGSPDGEFDARSMAVIPGLMAHYRQSADSNIRFTATWPIKIFSDSNKYAIDVGRVGWPWKTMQWRGPDDSRTQATTRLGRLYQSGVVMDSKRVLPLSPVWAGFGLSVLMWASGLALLAPFALWRLRSHRGKRRARRGQCTHCGYDIAGLVDCPECGTASASTTSGDA